MLVTFLLVMSVAQTDKTPDFMFMELIFQDK